EAVQRFIRADVVHRGRGVAGDDEVVRHVHQIDGSGKTHQQICEEGRARLFWSHCFARWVERMTILAKPTYGYPIRDTAKRCFTGAGRVRGMRYAREFWRVTNGQSCWVV